MSDDTALLRIDSLFVELPARGGHVEVLRDVSIEIPFGHIVGIVGESGSGKTMLLRCLLDILPEGARRRWHSIEFDGRDETANFGRRRLPISMVFQDPMTSFNPLMRMGDHLIEVARRFHRVGRAAARGMAREALESVRIPDPDRVLRCYPHELSGGLRQRVMIAMALLADPLLLVADEPTTALDATIQAEILALIRRLQQERALTVMLVTHDLGVVAALCDTVLVMKDGEIVERGPVDDVFAAPQHPYTRALLDATPAPPSGGAP